MKIAGQNFLKVGIEHMQKLGAEFSSLNNY